MIIVPKVKLDEVDEDWVSRPEIQEELKISSATFNNWRNEGRFGNPVAKVVLEGSRGRPTNLYSRTTVLENADRRKYMLAAPEGSVGLANQNVLMFFGIEDGAIVKLPVGELPSENWYIGLPSYLTGMTDKSDKSVFPDAPDITEEVDWVWCPPLARCRIRA